MKRKLITNVSMLIVISGLMLTVSCAKKNILSDDNLYNGKNGVISQEEKAAKEKALKAEDLARQKKNAIEEQRLNDESLNSSALATKRAARERFENQDIHFDYDSSELTPMSRMLLKEKAGWLSQNPHSAIIVEGHCDDRGTTEYNLALGEKRALAAQSYLYDLGISKNRINTISYGEEKPLVKGSDEASWAKNRRAHFVIH